MTESSRLLKLGGLHELEEGDHGSWRDGEGKLDARQDVEKYSWHSPKKSK